MLVSGTRPNVFVTDLLNEENFRLAYIVAYVHISKFSDGYATNVNT